MRAVLRTGDGGPEVLELGELPDPAYGADEVVLRVTAAGVNRADLMQREGRYPPPPGASRVLGLECSGEVVAVGRAVTGWQVGDRCVALLAGGGYAELVATPAGQLLPVPSGVDPLTAAGLVEVAATVVSNLDLAGLSSHESVLVHGGAGGIGSFAIPYATWLGARVLTTAGTEGKRDYCRGLGAERALDYHGDWVGEVAAATDGRGVDVILDIMGASYLGSNLAALATDGRLVVIGLQGGRRAEIDLGRLLARRGTILATSLRSRPVEQKAAICRRVAEVVWPLIETGVIAPTHQTVFDLERVAEAHRHLESGDNLGKVVLRVRDHPAPGKS